MNDISKNNIKNSLVLESLAVILRQNQKDIRQNQANIQSKGECLRELQREWYMGKKWLDDIDDDNDIDNNRNSLIMSSVSLNGDVLLFV